MAGKFLDPLELEYIDGVKWKLTAEFDYHLGTPNGLEFIKILAGFVTDFASVPKPLWNLLPPTGPYGKAAVVHDWCYQERAICVASTLPGVKPYCRQCDRAEADALLLEGMEVLSVGWWTRRLIYLGCRIGGWKPWNAYRAKERTS